MKFKIKPLFEYEQSPPNAKQILALEESISREKNKEFNYDWFRDKLMFEYFRQRCDHAKVECTDALKVFIVFSLSHGVYHSDLYVHALKYIAENESVGIVNIRLFKKYFEGYPDSFALKAAWNEQKKDGINLLEHGVI